MVRNDYEPLIYVIILCSNSKKWLKPCISSLLKTDYHNFKVLLVDNASTDGSADEIAALFPEIILIRNKRNYGWCKGNNIGIQYALGHGADMVFLANADTQYHSVDWLSQLVNIHKKHKQYSILGPLQYKYNSDMELNDWSEYILKNGSKNVHFPWSGMLNLHGKAYGKEALSSDLLDVYFIQGSAILIHKDVFQEVGFFDHLYFIFFDEVDFSRRNLRIGNRIALVPSSHIQHFGSGDNDSNKKRKRKKQFYFLRSKYFFHLSDYQMKPRVRYEILRKWIKCNCKDAVQTKEEVSGVCQLIFIYLHILFHLPVLLFKRRKEAIMEKAVVMSRLVDCINKVVNNFQISDFKKDLNIDFGLDSVGIMELLIILEEEFNMQFEADVDMSNLYSPKFLLQYICEYQR